MNEKQQILLVESYTAPTLELHVFSVEQGFANSTGSDYLEIGKDDYLDGPGFGDDRYNDLYF